MDSASDIATCKRLLEQLEAEERVTTTETLVRLTSIFEHLPPQVAPRLQKDYDYCTTRSDEILGNLFDKVEISDKSVLNLLLRLLFAYGNFRLAQVTYHIDTYRDEVQPDSRFTPIIVKTKWYDLTPLLPTAGTIGWKSIFIHGSVKDPDAPQLGGTCTQLLVQKLQFNAIISLMERFRFQQNEIQRNGERVAEKLAEAIFDCANDDQEVVEIDKFTFSLLLPFTTDEQQAALVEALVIAQFKSDFAEELQTRQTESLRRLWPLFCDCLMSKIKLQEILVLKLIEQLQCNIIRRKRRHSVESNSDDQSCTLESLLSAVVNGTSPAEVIEKAQGISLSSKTLQKSYLRRWVSFLHELLTKRTLTPRSAGLITLTSSVLLVCAWRTIEHDLSNQLSLLLAKTVDTTSQRRLDKYFKICGPSFLSSFTKCIAESTDLLEHFDTPVARFYRSYFSRQMISTTHKQYLKDAENFSQFVEFICNKTTIGKSKSHVLEYIYLCELSDCLENHRLKSGKLTETYVGYGKTISKKLYKFIKHRPFITPEFGEDADKPTNGGNGGTETPDHIQTVVINALVCILKIAVNRKEQQMLDTYGELMLKLYNLLCQRFQELFNITRIGSKGNDRAVDMQLVRLVNLYTNHRETIEPYLCYELNGKLCETSIIAKASVSGCNSEASSEKKKSNYAEIKSKLKSVSNKDSLTFESIINSQYSSAIEQGISQQCELEGEDLCYRRYLKHLNAINGVLKTIFLNCDIELYQRVLTDTTRQFETCDALDHPRFLNLVHVLEPLILRQFDKDAPKANHFKKAFPTIGCCLVAIAKSVELGPSVISFTNSGLHKSNGSIQCCTYSHCIRIYALIFKRFPPSFTNQLITDAMQICISANLTRYAKYSDRLFRFFIQLGSSIANLLKAICIGKRDVVEHAMPVFLAVLSLLIRCIILASDRKKLKQMPKTRINGFAGESNKGESEIDATEEKAKIFETQLEHLARDVGRLLNNLCNLETKLVEYAPHLISTYIRDTQRAPCPDYVKRHLDEGMFRVFNLVDAYQKDRLSKVMDTGAQRKMTAGQASGSLFEMIHARLDQASREIFRDMHDNYNKFHRYLGKC